MNRRDLLKNAAAFGVASMLPISGELSSATLQSQPSPDVVSLKAPADGVPVAFVLADGAVMIDFVGPWEVFQDASMPGDMAGMSHDLFRLYTVAETAKPITASAGMKIVPEYTFANAPAPKVIVIPAMASQNQPSAALQAWLRKAVKSADVVMSVCTGAFVLANTGLLAGKAATTHHSSYKSLAVNFPDIQVKRGARFVDNGSIATAGGLTSGIDLALHVVERYYGRDAANVTAYQMEYQGTGWMDANSNQAYAAKPVSTAAHPLCPVCDMDVNPAMSPKSVYKSNTYYFCSSEHKQLFDRTPDRYVAYLEESSTN